MSDSKHQTEHPVNPDPSEIAKAFSSLGASKGGEARAKSLTRERRQEIARHAVEARWRKAGKLKEHPKATHPGELRIGNMMIECAVLEDGTRVLSERAFTRELQVVRGGYEFRMRQKIGDGDLPIILANKRLIPFIDNDLMEALKTPIFYRPKHGGKLANGIDAKLVD